jgi:CRISPR-associated protein Csm4
MKAAILKCKSGSQFHFGRYAPDSDTALNDTSEIMHSDTLFAALVNTYNDIFNDTDDFVKCFEEGAIRVSSVFFCMEQQGKFVWFLPKPVSFDMIKADDYKSFKHIRYISKKLWEHIDSPKELADLMNSKEKKIAVLHDSFAMFKDEIELIAPDKEDAWKRLKLYYSVNLPKVQVREPKKEGNLYQLNVTEIADNSKRAAGLNTHYYFLYEFSDAIEEDFKERFKQVLKVLAHTGIGAERSTIGQLEEIIPEEKSWETPNGDSESHCTLSLLSPGEKDLPLLQFYRTMIRGGRAIGKKQENNQMHLQSLQMIREGAVVSREVKGKIHLINPQNSERMSLPKFKRCGTVVSLPLKKSWL